MTSSTPADGGGSALERGACGPRVAEIVAVARVLRLRDERELERRSTVDLAGRSLAGRADRRLAVAERHDRNGELVHAVGADEPRHGGVREDRAQTRGESGVRRHHEGLRQHRAGVPVDVAEAALGVAPAGAPGNAGDDERRRSRPPARGPICSSAWFGGIEPVHAVGKALDAAGGDVELEREAPAGRPRRAEEVAPAVGALGDAHDAGREVQHAREAGEIERGAAAPRHGPARTAVVGAAAGRPAARQLDGREPGRVGLAECRERREVVRLEVLDARGGRRPASPSRSPGPTRSGRTTSAGDRDARYRPGPREESSSTRVPAYARSLPAKR